MTDGQTSSINLLLANSLTANKPSVPVGSKSILIIYCSDHKPCALINWYWDVLLIALRPRHSGKWILMRPARFQSQVRPQGDRIARTHCRFQGSLWLKSPKNEVSKGIALHYLGRLGHFPTFATLLPPQAIKASNPIHLLELEDCEIELIAQIGSRGSRNAISFATVQIWADLKSRKTRWISVY